MACTADPTALAQILDSPLQLQVFKTSTAAPHQHPLHHRIVVREMKGSVLLFCDFSTIKAAFTAQPSKSTLDSLQSKCSCPNPGHFGSNRVWLLYLQPPATVLQFVLPRMCLSQVHELPSSQPHIGDPLGIHSLPCLPTPSPDLRTLSMWMKWHFG